MFGDLGLVRCERISEVIMADQDAIVPPVTANLDQGIIIPPYK